MFYIQQDKKIVLVDENLERLQNTIAIMPQYKGLEIQEVEEGYVIYDFELMTVEEMKKKQAQARKTTFENQFFQIPSIENVFVGGWYRKKPKGYASAVESLNTCFNAVLALNKLPADTLIFYTQPDYSKADECTEEWLIAHQFKNEEMTKEQFMQFYSVFMTAWNATEH